MNRMFVRTGFALMLLGIMLVGVAHADLTPGEISATLYPGESVTEAKAVDMPAVIPKADIIFSFDLTGSMGGTINTAKAEAINIMNNLDALIGDARYAVASYMDYPGSYSSCEYSGLYGDASYGDYAYNLDLPMSADRPNIAAAINSLSLGYGGDGPQDYERVMYESYADPSIGYRVGSKKILLNFGDNVPHDCDLNEGVTSGTWTTGSDPGRDEVMGTADDLDLNDVLAGMAASDITLLEVHANNYYQAYWDYWCGITGGAMYVLGSSSDVPVAIQELVEGEATYLSSLTLEVITPGYEAWLSSVVPAEYTDIALPADRGFDIVITVPGDAEPGVHVFEIAAIGDGASYGEQLVTITVPGGEGDVFGKVVGPCMNIEGAIVDLYQGTSLVGTETTDAMGDYRFEDVPAGDYTVELQVPLGFIPASDPGVPITVVGSDVEVNFALDVVDVGKRRNVWWWKYQVAALRGDVDRTPEVTVEEINDYCQLIFDHYYNRPDEHAMCIEWVTFVGDPAGPLTFDDVAYFFWDYPDPDMTFRYEAYLLAHLFNIVSGRMGQWEVVSADGATASQAIYYLTSIYDSGDRADLQTAFYNSRRIHLNQMIPAGIIPAGVPNIMYKPGDEELLPQQFTLEQNYPNPFNPVTEIAFTLPSATEVTLSVYNITGQRVATLINGVMDAGPHTVAWDAEGFASGIYLYRLEAGDMMQTKKMVLLK